MAFTAAIGVLLLFVGCAVTFPGEEPGYLNYNWWGVFMSKCDIILLTFLSDHRNHITIDLVIQLYSKVDLYDRQHTVECDFHWSVHFFFSKSVNIVYCMYMYVMGT